MITLVSKEKRQIIVYDIAFDRRRERIQRLVDNSPKASKYYSDTCVVCSEIIYHGDHTSLKNKSQTYTVEGVKSDLRYYIPALRRMSKCFFKSIDTMKAVFLIFVHTFNQFIQTRFILRR